ncbi:caprin-2-like [Ruditapes philippinarum]|uniref:caprin-2-like n=1 Tax=Ruditapes philippinarum TaxID=129788 RepID=UPI00295B04AC|nr:caprin-2-like [Ruditapes philippinarum]
MKMFSYAFFITLFLTVKAEEQHCSKYDFEERILEKLVRMEYQMEKLKLEGIEREESTTKMKDEVRTAIDVLNKTTDKFEMSLKVKANTFEQSIVVRVGELRKTVDVIADKAKIPTVAFKARLNSHLSDASTGSYIIFPITMFNEGSAFDSSTGKFTVPVNGTYLFTVIFCVQSKQSLHIDITVDGQTTQPVTLRSEGNAACQSAALLEVLIVGQTVGVKVTSRFSTNTVYHGSYRWNSFSGTLIRGN